MRAIVMSLVVASLTIGGIALLHVRRGLLGDVALGLLSADAAAWLAPAAADNISHHDRFAAIVVPTTVAGGGLPAFGVTAFEAADGPLVPTALVAVTVKV